MYLVFDIGGTNMRIASSQDGKNLDQIETLSTLTNFSEAMSAFEKVALNLTKGQKVKVAVGGVRSLDMKTKAKLRPHPTIPLWVDEPLKETLEQKLNTNVYLENDTALVGLGEATVGAGKGKKIVAYITVSTGIGGVRIVEGKIDQNYLGFEPGNQIIDADVSLKPAVDFPGYLERYVGGNALEKRYGIKPENIEDPKIWDEMAKLLAIGLNNIIVHWSPEVVILGGTVGRRIPLEKVRIYLKEFLKIFPEIPDVLPASLGDQGGLLGSLAYLKKAEAV